MIIINSIQFEEGDIARVTVDSWNGEIVIAEGYLKYKNDDVSSYGAGWGIEDTRRGFTFFSNISKSHTKLVKLGKEG